MPQPRGRRTEGLEKAAGPHRNRRGALAWNLSIRSKRCPGIA
jgi:hypothetical protein